MSAPAVADLIPRISLRPRTGDLSTVHVWSYRTRAAGDLAGDLGLLDGTERARAARFRFERDRRRYVQRHAFARRVLARYLDAGPAGIDIRRTTLGKPVLDRSHGLTFSLSQADEMAVMGVAAGRPVGVDIERVRPVDDASELADELFTAPEVDFLRSVPAASRSRAFLTLWTRKESLVKAVGGGLSIPLDSFSVLAGIDDAIRKPRSGFGELPFVLAAIDAAPGYVGSVSIAGAQVAVRNIGAGSPIRNPLEPRVDR